MILSPPPPDIQVMRRGKNWEHKHPGKWHFLKNGGPGNE